MESKEAFLTDIHKNDKSVGKPVRLWLIVLSVSSFIFTVALVLVVIVMDMSKSQVLQTADVDDDTLCFTCNHVGQSVRSEDTVYDIHRLDNVTLCCYRENDNNEFARKLTTDYIKNKATKAMNADLTTYLIHSNRTGAHLHLDSRALLEGNLSWNADDKSSYVSGLETSAVSLTIPEHGVYLVYSHITYTRKFPHTHGASTFTHSITRSHPRQPNLGDVLILVRKDAYPKFTAQKSSFLSAILSLRKGDNLRVNVSDRDSVHDDSRLSYFGVFKI